MLAKIAKTSAKISKTSGRTINTLPLFPKIVLGDLGARLGASYEKLSGIGDKGAGGLARVRMNRAGSRQVTGHFSSSYA
ncbi:MAG TPA: hypothetical protein VGJ92_11615 [Methanocella sp.]|jgi:hypothetical protein